MALSPSAPYIVRLYFKSPDSRDATQTAEAVLCTPNKTYVMRQQQTSNGVHIIAPASTACGTDEIPEPGLTAISQCTSSLELMAAPVDSAKSALKDILPVFIDSEDAERTLPEYHDKESLFTHIPMSEAECQNAWTDLVAFELIPSRNLPRRCFRPSANVLLNTWTRLKDIALSEGINLAGTLRTGTMLEALWNPDEEWPYELRAAIMNRLISNRAILSEKEHAESALRDGSTLDRSVTVRWLGLLILQAHRESQPASPRIPKDVFVDTWKDSLPEEWREDAKIDALPVRMLISNHINSTDSYAERTIRCRRRPYQI